MYHCLLASWHFGAKSPRDELLNGEIFYSSKESQITVEQWRRHHDAVGRHLSPGYWSPALQTPSPFPQPLDQGATMQ
jgi:hypothetical protein